MTYQLDNICWADIIMGVEWGENLVMPLVTEIQNPPMSNVKFCSMTHPGFYSSNLGNFDEGRATDRFCGFPNRWTGANLPK